MQDNEGDTPLHMVELVQIAQAMIEELGADPSIRNHDGLTAAEKIREEADFDEVAEYLEGVTPGIHRSEELEGSGTLAYAEFRSASEDEEGEIRDERLLRLDREMHEDVGRRMVEAITAEREDGVNRDELLRQLLSDTLMRAAGRGSDGNGNGNGNGDGHGNSAGNRRRPNNDSGDGVD